MATPPNPHVHRLSGAPDIVNVRSSRRPRCASPRASSAYPTRHSTALIVRPRRMAHVDPRQSSLVASHRNRHLLSFTVGLTACVTRGTGGRGPCVCKGRDRPDRRVHVLFGRHCLFEKSRPQPLLMSLTSSAPKRTTMATICLTSSSLPAASSQLLHPRKRRLPHEEIETAPSVFGAPDMAAMLLTSSQLRAPSGSAIQPGSHASPTSALALRKNSLVTLPRRKTPYITVGRTGCASAAGWTGATLAHRPGRCQDARSTRQGRDRPGRQLHALVRRHPFSKTCPLHRRRR